MEISQQFVVFSEYINFTNQHSDILKVANSQRVQLFCVFWQKETKIKMPSERGQKLPILLFKKTTKRGRGSKIADFETT